MKTIDLRPYPWRTFLGIFVMVVLLMGMCERKCSGQGAIYLLHQPVDNGIGVRVDYYPLSGKDHGKLIPGLYHSASYGSGGLYKMYGLKDHIKLTTGILIPLEPYNSDRVDISAAFNYHQLSRGESGDYQVNERILGHWSFELGADVKFRCLAVCVSTDILRWEPCIGIGIVF